MREHDETPIPLALVPPLLPSFRSGRPPCVETIRRWARTGELEAVRIGGVYFTTRRAIEQFVRERTDGTRTGVPPSGGAQS